MWWNIISEYMKICKGIPVSDILGWILTGIAGAIAYKLIDHIQTSMTRHELLKGIEETFSNIYNSQIAFVSEGKRKRHKVMVRTLLDDKENWMTNIHEGDINNKIKVLDNQRYIQIRKRSSIAGKRTEWMSTQALHEILLLCKRIEKMYKSHIIKRIDLVDMQREILPLGMSGRIEFFAAYFGYYDAECIAYLVMQTVVSCEQYHNTEAVLDFCNYYKNHMDIHSYFEKSVRLRRIYDRAAVRKFRALCNH